MVLEDKQTKYHEIEADKGLKNSELKDKLDFVDELNILKTENPVFKLSFQKPNKRNVYLSLIVICLIGLSILSNMFFLEKFDRIVINFFSHPQSYIYNLVNKPFVVTIGEYGNLGVAKDEAIRLLPKLKQIKITQLNSGIYTFELDRFAFKEEAYSLAKMCEIEDFDAVHVRYLPSQ